MKKTLKSGKIEFYRFIFSLCVLGFHMGKYFRGEPDLEAGLRFEFFPHGSIAVEFFFLVSGFFMARTISRKVQAEANSPVKKTDRELSVEYVSFMKHKYFRILPEHIPMFLMTFVIYVVVNHERLGKIFILVFRNIPSFFLLQMSAISLGNVLHIEWYISAMLIAMAILYPICRKYYYTFSRYFAPLLGLLVLGYIQKKTSSLTGVSVWMGLGYKGLLRAIVEIALGTTCYEVSQYLGERFQGGERKWKWFWTAVEAGCFGVSMLFVMTTMEKMYEILLLGVFFLLLAVASSGISYGVELFDRKTIYFLGKMSLPIYLGQLAAIYIVSEKMADRDFPLQIAACLGLTLVFVIFTEIMAKPLNRMLNGDRKK